MKKKEVMMEVGFILDTYCDGCLLKRVNQHDYGKCHAQRFCITECTVGDELRQLGKHLT
ncbi:zinc-finger domain-containing protein [Guptibacillus algicola]|uniref:zinc-finger domain-containing protein n=1 Tax=Guptibacillus algicola TaxID=225844 RepID=UPI001CD4FB17|nr:zinc-finger domain-containing protein [Alkalihalobacillus algicola]MCA0988195.1 zinc-finger domain-containing protein [Alkalihalobacillus algicola]